MIGEMVIYQIKPDFKHEFNLVYEQMCFAFSKCQGYVKHEHIKHFHPDEIYCDTWYFESLGCAENASHIFKCLPQAKIFMSSVEKVIYKAHFEL